VRYCDLRFALHSALDQPVEVPKMVKHDQGSQKLGQGPKKINTNKTKVMIIKSNNITYDTFVYKKNNLEEVTSYKYLGINIHHKINWNYSIEKRIIGGWKDYYGLERSCK
jgi:hypothetical protein